MTGTREEPDRPGISPFARRSFLASAAVAAAGAGAAPAAAAGRPAGARDPGPWDFPPPAGGTPGSVAQLLGVPGTGRDVGWIRSALQTAVAIELSTIPPYLCGWWSVKDRTSEVAGLISRIVGDEMYHLGVVCNLLVAVGGRPRIKDAAPRYPGPLPGGVRSGVNVYLSGLTKPFVRDVMMAIEAPETPLARSARNSPSVGGFYEELVTAFRAVKPSLSTAGQLSSRIGSDTLKPVRDLAGVEQSIEIVKEQGEGTGSSPDDSFADDHPAHYYAFGEIYHGRRVRESDGVWDFTGSAVPFPDARPMAPVPAGGWPDPPARVRRLLDQFDTTYHSVLDTLDEAWSGGGERSLTSAVRAMRAMEAPALELMGIALPDAPGTYGPRFGPPAS